MVARAWRSFLLLLGLLPARASSQDGAPASTPQSRPALKGLDPVELTQGRETPGDGQLAVHHGPFTYAFAHAANRDAFGKDPERFAIQLGGACARMGPLADPGDPDEFRVHDGRIYAFCADVCSKCFKAAPALHVDADDAPPIGDEAARARGRELIALLLAAVEAPGGTGKVDRISGWRAVEERRRKDWDGAEVTVREATMLVPLDRARFEHEWGDWRRAEVLAGELAFATDTKTTHTTTLGSAARAFLRRMAAREPLLILRARGRSDFVAVAAGRGRVDDVDVDVVQVAFDGATTTLWLAASDHRLVATCWRGRPWLGPIGDVEVRFADYRDVSGLVLPFARVATCDGKPAPALTRSFTAMSLADKFAADASLWRPAPR